MLWQDPRDQVRIFIEHAVAMESVEVAYACAFTAMILVASFVYAYRGVVVVARIVGYISSLATMTISIRFLYTKHAFTFPTFVTCIHLACSAMLCCAIMAYRYYSQGRVAAVPRLSQFLCMILPIAMSFVLSIGASNVALLHSNAAFVEMVSSSTPVFVVLGAVLWGRGFHARLLPPVLVVCLGLALCAAGELRFSVAGFMLAFLASILRASKATLQAALLDPAAKDDQDYVVLDPVELLAWMSLPSIAIMAVWSCITEGSKPLERLREADGRLPLVVALGLSCTIACSLNLLGLVVLQDLGPVGAQIAGQLKAVLTVLGGMALLKEIVGPLQPLGFAAVLAGVLWYGRQDAALQAERGKPAGEPASGQRSGTPDERTRLLA